MADIVDSAGKWAHVWLHYKWVICKRYCQFCDISIGFLLICVRDKSWSLSAECDTYFLSWTARLCGIVVIWVPVSLSPIQLAVFLAKLKVVHQQ